jgi:hypothetical protein
LSLDERDGHSLLSLLRTRGWHRRDAFGSELSPLPSPPYLPAVFVVPFSAVTHHPSIKTPIISVSKSNPRVPVPAPRDTWASLQHGLGGPQGWDDRGRSWIQGHRTQPPGDNQTHHNRVNGDHGDNGEDGNHGDVKARKEDRTENMLPMKPQLSTLSPLVELWYIVLLNLHNPQARWPWVSPGNWGREVRLAMTELGTLKSVLLT